MRIIPVFVFAALVVGGFLLGHYAVYRHTHNSDCVQVGGDGRWWKQDGKQMVADVACPYGVRWEDVR